MVLSNSGQKLQKSFVRMFRVIIVKMFEYHSNIFTCVLGITRPPPKTRT